MQFGRLSEFAIECLHEPIPNESGQVFGRMCLWIESERVGDFDEPACMLNVTAVRLQQALRKLPDIEEPTFVRLADAEVFRVLDDALYQDRGQTSAQVVADSTRYWKYDFLTNGGESFDKTKSFICVDGEGVRLIFEQLEGSASRIIGGRVPATEFTRVVSEFLQWIEAQEGEHAG